MRERKRFQLESARHIRQRFEHIHTSELQMLLQREHKRMVALLPACFLQVKVHSGDEMWTIRWWLKCHSMFARSNREAAESLCMK